MTPEQGQPGAPQGSPGTPGREAEEVPVDGESPSPSPDTDRNLTPSEAGALRTGLQVSPPRPPKEGRTKSSRI